MDFYAFPDSIQTHPSRVGRSALAIFTERRAAQLKKNASLALRSNANAIYQSEIKTFGPNLVRHL